MPSVQEFLVLDEGDKIGVYGAGALPPGVMVVGRSEAQKMRVIGPIPVRPPRTALTRDQWQAWLDGLEAATFRTEFEPFWSAPFPPVDAPTRPLAEVFDELRRQAR